MKKKWSRPIAIGAMVLCAFLWSTAGVVTKQLHGAFTYEVAFWRSLFTALTLLIFLPLMVNRQWYLAVPWRRVELWLSGFCWSVMFTAFMVAIVLTSVANVLITLSAGPLLTALVSRLVTKQPLPNHTWVAIALAGFGIGYMFWSQIQVGSTNDLLGCLIALAVPMAGSIMWTITQRQQIKGGELDLVPCVLLGGIISSVLMLPLAWPLQGDAHDIAWLAGLGVFQLALPCTLAVIAARTLRAAEAAMLALLEIIFGITWAWLFVNETPTTQVMLGGALVIFALAGNAVLGFRTKDQLPAKAP